MGRGKRPAAEPFLRVSWVDPDHGWRGFAVIDRLIDGLAGGGIRMRAGVTMGEVEDLARAMSRKKAVAGALGGGAKGGIDLDPADPLADDALRAYVRAMAPLFGTCWSTAGDLGVPEGRLSEVFADLGLGLTVQALCNHTGDPHVAAQAIDTALAVVVDGIPLSDCTAGYGVARAVVAALEHAGRRVDGTTVAIQGFGSIGGTAARYLHAAGLRIVGVADADGLVVDPSGIDVDALLRCRDRHGVLDRARLPAGCRREDGADWLALDVDVLVPAATSAAIDVADCERITARWIVEAANLPTTPAAQHRLTQAGVRIIPDVVANAGTTAWFTWLATAEIEPTPMSTFLRLDALMAETVPAVLRLADERGTTTHDAAAALAEQRLVARRCDLQSVLATVEAEQERTARQVASLEAVLASIVEGSELTSTDDEHDPEGATIAYERAQTIALLRQARADLEALVITRRQLDERQQVVCSVCRRDIDLERIAALPTTTRCVRCAA